MITSLQNEKVKLAHSLQNRPRKRRAERKIALEGTRLVADALAVGLKPIYVLIDPDSIDPDLMVQLTALDDRVFPVTPQILKHVSDTQQPQGVVAVMHLPMPQIPHQPSRALVLDRIGDPGNLGTMLRTAAAASVDVVLLSPECADPYNPKVLRSGMGAHFRLPIVEAPWHEITTYTESLAVYIAAAHGTQRYDQVDWRERFALIIGSEAHGVSQRAQELAQASVSIPMAGQTESLNAAVAAGVLLFEAVRQNLTDTPDSL